MKEYYAVTLDYDLSRTLFKSSSEFTVGKSFFEDLVMSLSSHLRVDHNQLIKTKIIGIPVAWMDKVQTLFEFRGNNLYPILQKVEIDNAKPKIE